MAGPPPLAAWLHGVRVARIDQVRSGKMALTYTEDALDRWPRNTAVLSASLPLQGERFAPGRAGPYLDGLLPEGEARSTLERRFGVRRGDSYGLLAAIGRDCAGAVIVRPWDDDPSDEPVPNLRPLGEGDLARALAALPEHPLGAGGEVRVSLAGQQTKLLLARTAEGWAWPGGGMPSTHILKPEDARYPAMVANEAFCLRVATELGATDIDVDTFAVDGRPVLAVSRYDRRRSGQAVERLHQEDLCQALGVDTSRQDAKYEAFGGPTLRQVADVLDRFSGTIEDLDRLLDATALNVVLGNADAHGRNLSLLYDSVGRPRLAPLYDLVSTIQYPTVATPDGDRPVSTQLAMSIVGLTSLDAVTRDHLATEASTWDYARPRALTRIAALLEHLPAAVDRAAEATPGVPENLVARTLSRGRSLARGDAAGS